MEKRGGFLLIEAMMGCAILAVVIALAIVFVQAAGTTEREKNYLAAIFLLQKEVNRAKEDVGSGAREYSCEEKLSVNGVSYVVRREVKKDAAELICQVNIRWSEYGSWRELELSAVLPGG